jgi:hypothetical protein
MTLIIQKPTGAKLNLDSGNQPAAIAGVAPTLDYRFARDRSEIETVSLTDKLTFTRAAACSFTNQAGNLQLATANQPRFDHNPLSKLSKGLLIESSSTNLVLYSQDFANGYWNSTQGTVSTGFVSPDQTPTAWRLQNSTAANVARGNSISSLDSQVYTRSVFAKAGSISTIYLSDHNTATFGYRASFDLTSVSVLSVGDNQSARIEDIGNDWRRVSMSSISNAAVNSRFAVGFDTAGDIFIWGAQVELASNESSYIPTTTSAITRNESAAIDGTGVITGTYTMVEKPAGCAVVSGTNINLQTAFTAERVMVFPAALDAGQITAIRGAM